MHGQQLRTPSELEINPTSSKYGRMFAPAANPDRFPDSRKLAELMHPDSSGEDSPDLPAAYTYLGQFIDHDLTLDLTSNFEQQSDPNATYNFRTPSLELDNLYGSGPSASPHLYSKKDRGLLLLGKPEELPGADDPKAPGKWDFDLPRNSEGTALLGDARDDENLIIGQLHVAFVRFHNAVYRKTSAGQDTSSPKVVEACFRSTQRIVRWHYQWLILHDYLPRICRGPLGAELTDGGILIQDIIDNGRKLFDPEEHAPEPFVPIEFAVAAFRLGHTQIRDRYVLNGHHEDEIDIANREPSIVSSEGKLLRYQLNEGKARFDLQGGCIRWRDVIDWKRFASRSPLAENDGVQGAKRLDTQLAVPLRQLPTSMLRGSPEMFSLAARNLQRALTFSLCSGQSAAAVAEKRIGAPILSQAQIWSGEFDRFSGMAAPLWFYLLREAEVHGASGQRLGYLGSRIVAEVLIGVMQKDRCSFLRDEPSWTPTLGRIDGRFDLWDLLQIAGMPGTE